MIIRLKRLGKSFIYATRGLFKVFREEQNLLIQSFFALIAIFFGVYLNISANQWCIILLTILIVLLMEIINSALERTTDMLKPRIHMYVKEIKDIMAAAVMLASFFAIIIGLIIFLPYFFALGKI